MITYDYLAGAALNFGTEPVMLIDETTVEDRWNVRRALNTPIKEPTNPVLRKDRPWESQVCQMNVIYDEEAGIYRAWYANQDAEAFMRFRWTPRGPGDERQGYPLSVLYAESQDGLHWEKPIFDDKPYRHYEKTNVVFTGNERAQSPRVMPNPDCTGRPEKYLMTYKDHFHGKGGCLCFAYSDDGVHWEEDTRNPIFEGITDTWHNMVHEPRSGKWFMYTRPYSSSCAGVPNTPGWPTEFNHRRRVAVMVGDSPFEFGSPRTILWPDEECGPDFDHMMVYRTGSHFIGLIGEMSAPQRQEFTTRLAMSGDGINWKLLPGNPAYLPHGPEGSVDMGSTYSPGALVNVGDMNYLYYVGSTHGQSMGSQNSMTAICRAEFKQDRFVAQLGAHEGGYLLTREMIVTAPELVLNTTVADGYNSDPSRVNFEPEIKVELLASDGPGKMPQPIPGFGREDCTTKYMLLDQTEHRVTWKDKPDLSELVGKPVQIRFYLKDFGLYSLRFRHPI